MKQQNELSVFIDVIMLPGNLISGHMQRFGHDDPVMRIMKGTVSLVLLRNAVIDDYIDESRGSANQLTTGAHPGDVKDPLKRRAITFLDQSSSELITIEQ